MKVNHLDQDFHQILLLFVWLFYINNNYQVLHSEVVARGGKSLEVHMDYEHICNQAKLHRATKVIIAHNHPTGDVGPSEADYLCTCRLYALLRQNDISLIDHIIIGENDFYSYLQSGLIDDYLKTTTDVVNNNAELLAELESYVKNYFDNRLQEIKNALDIENINVNPAELNEP